MIRRDVVRSDRDQKVVKWSLIAAVFALTVGCFAEVTLVRHVDDTSAVASQKLQAEAPNSVSTTG
jgi:hypothetical protein